MDIRDANQLSLDLGLPPLAVRRPPPVGDRVFFAATPPPKIADDLASVARRIGAGRGLAAAWRPARVLHVSLAGVGMWEALPRESVRQALTAGAALEAQAFPVRFVQALVFGTAHRKPFVLCCDEAGIVPLAGLARALSLGLAGAARPSVRERFVPHLTVGYTRGIIEPIAIDVPGWTVRDVVLVRSLHGETRHEELGRWPLADPGTGQHKGGG